MTDRRPTLKEIASRAGFTPESLARIIGCDRSTIYKYWIDQDWVAKISWDTLRKLMKIVPGVPEEVGIAIIVQRRKEVTQRLRSAGLSVNDCALDRALDDPEIKAQFLFTALDAASYVVSEAHEHAQNALRSLWGRPQTRALDAVFGTHPAHSVLQEPDELVKVSEAMLAVLANKRGSSYQRSIAQAHLAHHIGKATGRLTTDLRRPLTQKTSVGKKQKDGFFVRGSYMGVLRQNDDIDVAERYAEVVARDGIARLVEAWAFPSWTGDIESHDEFAVPGHIVLVHTAAEIIYELETYNDAYVWYLASTFVPLALEELDKTFGNRLDALKDTLAKRADMCGLEEVAQACAAMSRQLAHVVG